MTPKNAPAPSTPTSSSTDVFTLYEQHAAALLAFLRPRCAGSLAAEDVAQQVWLQVHDHLRQQGTFTGNARAWLFQIARHVMVDMTRRKRPESLPEDTVAIAKGGTPLDAMIGAEFQQRLVSCLGKLPPVWADLIRRRSVGETPATIAPEVNMSPEQVYKALSSARRELEGCMGMKREDL